MTLCDVSSHSLKSQCHLSIPFLFDYFSPSHSGFLSLLKCISLSFAHLQACTLTVSFLCGLWFCHLLLPPKSLSLLLFREFHSCIVFILLSGFRKKLKNNFLGAGSFLWIQFFLFVAFIPIVISFFPIIPTFRFDDGGRVCLLHGRIPSAQCVEDTQ